MSEVTHAPIPVGTTFYVSLGDVYVMGLVHASATFPSAAGVMYVQMIGPPLRREGWQPEYNSWWIVDDLAIRDGSWPFQAPVDDFSAEPLRRFGGMDGVKPVLVTIAPDTLTLAGTAAADTPETRAEWDDAPKLASPIPSVFEASLARTMDLPQPERPRDDDENASRFVIANARLNDAHVTEPRSFDFTMRFRSERAGEQARDEAVADGFAAALERHDRTPPYWTLTIPADIVPAYPNVAPHIERWSALAQKHRGEFDGFGAWQRGWSAERALREAEEA